jgi:hypothetical protein
MFIKKKLAFSDKKVFGYNFRTSIEYCFTKTAKMLFAGKVNYDGTIDETKSDTFTLTELWAYIYYLYYYNNSDLDEFKAMKSKDTGKADAINFYNVVASVSTGQPVDIRLGSHLTLNSKLLISFINKIILTYNDDLVNPMFDYLKVLSQKHIITKLSGIKLVTGQTNGEFEVVQNTKNANIKIELRKTI